MPVVPGLLLQNRAERLERLLITAFALEHPDRVPAKLGLPPRRYAALRRFLAGGEPPAVGLAPELARVCDALSAVGLRERYFEIVTGVDFPLEWASVRWRRSLGPVSPERDALNRALERLGVERVGLTLQRHVMIGSDYVDWAIAGLLPTGRPLRLALVVRPAPTPLAALAEDLADDAIAEAGFAILGLRDWQLVQPEACAAHVAAVLKEFAPDVALPSRPIAPEDAAPALPQRLTPRERSPNFALREALRRSWPQLGRAALLARYRAHVIDRTVETAEEGEYSVLGG